MSSVLTTEKVSFIHRYKTSTGDLSPIVKFTDSPFLFENKIIDSNPTNDNLGDIIETFKPITIKERHDNIKNNPTNSASANPVRRFLEHYNSLRPIAILVDDSLDSNSAARNFMSSVFEVAPTARHITFLISKFNDSGVTNLVEISGNDARKINETLMYKKNDETSFLGSSRSKGSVAFFAILNAAAALPQGGAIIVFLDRKPADEDLASHTGIIRTNNIKVYVVWGGPYPSKTNDERLLKDLCLYSEGLFLINKKQNLSSYNYRLFLENEYLAMNTSVLLVKTNLYGESRINLPIDSEVTGIHLIIAPICSGSLTSPTGQKLNFENDVEVADYGNGSFSIVESNRREIYLRTTQAFASVGVWRLIIDSAPAPYNISVFVYTKLAARAYLVRKKTGDDDATKKKQVLKLDFTGHVGSVNNVTFIDTNGKSFGNIMSFNEKKDFLTMENASIGENQFNLEVDDVPHQPFHVLVQGIDIRGNTFSRLTYVNEKVSTNIFPQPMLGIDVGLGSGLIITGGKISVVTLEVTNFRSTSAAVRFFCKDERSILSSMTPYYQVIIPQETAIVRVSMSPTYGTYQDIVTFSAMVGSEVIEKKIQVDVGGSQIVDHTEPTLSYNYLSDCSKVQFGSCEDGTWTIEVKAKDTESGLLQVISNPKGLYFPNGYTTGTKEEVTGYYSDSCCNPDFQLIAVDRMDNRRTINPNAYRASLGPGQISAIVLGILLFILLIVLIVYLIRRCIKKREAYNLPTYSGRRI